MWGWISGWVGLGVGYQRANKSRSQVSSRKNALGEKSPHSTTWASGIGPVLQESKLRLQGVKKVDPNRVTGSVLETSSHASRVPFGQGQCWVSTKPVSFHTSLPPSRKKPRCSILIILLYEGTFSALGVINRDLNTGPGGDSR